MGLLDRLKSSDEDEDGDEGPKVAFIGIDGVPRSLVREMIDQGRFPNLESLIDTGGLASMDAVIPAESSACWPAMTTGTNPGKTGVLGFQERELGTYDTYISLGKHVKSERIWRVMERENKKSLVMNIPVTFPPEDINGTMISGFLTPNVDKVSNDPEVVDYLKSIDYNIDVDAGIGHDDKHEFMENARETLEKRVEALFHLMEEKDWSLLWNVFMATDRVNHFLWENYEEGDELGEEFIEFYERVDEIIGEIRERLDDDTTMIVAADHGFTRLDNEFDINAWLREQGWQSVDAPEDAERYELEHITDDTQAYSMIPGRIYINKEDREPRGSVSEEEYEELRDEIAEALLDVEGPDGSSVITEVKKREDIYEGSEYDMTPDLVALPEWGYDLKASFDPEKPMFEKGARNGMHTLEDATLIIEGHDVRGEDNTIMDVAPTILDLMEIDISEDIDGESLVK